MILLGSLGLDEVILNTTHRAISDSSATTNSEGKSAYGTKLYEGKAKEIYQTPQGTLIHYFKNSATAFNAQKKSEFEGKGATNLKISALLFELLKQKGVSSHFIRLIDSRAFETEALTMLPVEVVVRNFLAGSLAKRLQEPEGRPLQPPLVEFYLKDDAKGDPLVSEDILVALYDQKAHDLETLRKLALQVNEILKDFFKSVHLKLVDFKLEFGKDRLGKILLADEISPDTCRLWDLGTGEKLDKDRFRFDLGDLMEGYQKVLQKVEGALSK